MVLVQLAGQEDEKRGELAMKLHNTLMSIKVFLFI